MSRSEKVHSCTRVVSHIPFMQPSTSFRAVQFCDKIDREMVAMLTAWVVLPCWILWWQVCRKIDTIGWPWSRWLSRSGCRVELPWRQGRNCKLCRRWSFDRTCRCRHRRKRQRSLNPRGEVLKEKIQHLLDAGSYILEVSPRWLIRFECHLHNMARFHHLIVPKLVLFGSWTHKLSTKWMLSYKLRTVFELWSFVTSCDFCCVRK